MQCWGISAHIDIQNCNPNIIRSKEKIQEFVIQLCKKIDLVRFGDCQIVDFGLGDKHGYSMVQFVETSCITAHFANSSDTAFIDIFSCKDFDIKDVENFTLSFFGGEKSLCHYKNRYIL